MNRISGLPRWVRLGSIPLAVLLSALVLASLSGFYLFSGGGSGGALLVEPVVRGDIENFISATGTLEPRDYVEVGAQVSGQVQKIHVAEGDRVKAGDLVAEIDATVFETRVQNAEAGLEANRAQLRQLQAELELAQLRARRNDNLYRQKAVSEDTLFESRANVKILRAQISAKQAQIKADTASLAGDKATLNYARIYAPISGTVVSISVREGQTINASQNAPVLLKIADLSVLTLRAEVSEADVTRLRRGMPVYFKTFGGGPRRWHSTLRQVLPTPTVVNDVVLYQALVDIDNDDGVLMDAMTAQVFFVLQQAHHTLIVPLGAVSRSGSGVGAGSEMGKRSEARERSEVKVQRDGALVTTPVTTGVRNRTHVEITAGLEEGERVVVGGKARGGPRG